MLLVVSYKRLFQRICSIVQTMCFLQATMLTVQTNEEHEW